jgi:hypothetical protein
MEHPWKTFIKAHLKKLIIPAKYTETGVPEFPEDRYRRWETQDLAIEITDGTMMSDNYDMLVNPDFELTLDIRSDDYLVIISIDYGRKQVPWHDVVNIAITGNGFVW